MKTFTTFLVFLTYSVASSTLQDGGKLHSDPPDAKAVLVSNETAAFIDNLVGEWNSTGAALAVVQKDDAVTDPTHPGWRIEFGSYGCASKNTTSTKPMTPDTLFSIASNSKLFLAISVGLLLHNKTLADDFKGKHGVELGWKTRMQELLGEDWEMWDEDVTKGATIADLLGHRTGLPRHDYVRVWRKGGVREQVQKLRYLRPSAGFRETFQYSNLMYETLSYLPELLLNQTYESYVAEHLLEPLNMSSTLFSLADIDPYPQKGNPIGIFADRLADGYIASDRDLTLGKPGLLKPIVPFFSRPGEERTRAGAGGVISTARDLATWNAMLLSNGAHPFKPNVTIVPSEVLDWITTGRSVLSGVPKYPDTSPMVYGAAQIRYSYRCLDVIEHDGDYPGFKSVVSRYPKEGLGVVALSNDGENGGWVMNSAKWAVVDDVVFGEVEGRVKWSERFRDGVAAQRKAKQEQVTPRPRQPAPPTRPFSELGTKKFNHPAYGEIVLSRVPPSLHTYPRRYPPAEIPVSASSPLTHFKQRPVPLIPDEDTLGDDDEYGNPHTNCNQLTSSPSVRHILSSTFRASFRPPSPSIQDHSDTQPPETFITSFPHSFASHLLLVHFSGNVFNVSAVWANDDVRRDLGIASGSVYGEEDASLGQDCRATLVGLDETFTLEWVTNGQNAEDKPEEGLAIRGGFWGMQGPDAKAPEGREREAAEVWFGAVRD